MVLRNVPRGWARGTVHVFKHCSTRIGFAVPFVIYVVDKLKFQQVAGGSREWDEFILDDLRVYFEKFGILTNFVYRNSADDKIEILLSYPDRDVHFKMSYLDGQVRFNGHNLSIRELPAAAA